MRSLKTTGNLRNNYRNVFATYMLYTACLLVLLRKITLISSKRETTFNPLNPELNAICYLLALLAHYFLHVNRIRVKSLTLRLLMSHTHTYIYIYIYIYIYMERLFLMFLDHTQRRTTVGRTPLDE